MTRSDRVAAVAAILTILGAAACAALFNTTWAAITGILGAAFTAHFCWRGIRTRLLHTVRADTREQLWLTAVEIENSIVLRSRLPEVMPPLSTYSMCSTNLSFLLSSLDRVEPRVVVEFGSGLSTLATAEWLRRFGKGKLYTVEHDEFWADVVRQAIRRNCLEPFVELIVAKLAETNETEGCRRWYDPRCLERLPAGIDLVVVDGPPPSAGDQIRWPALPFLHGKLSANAMLLLDDGNRDGERAIAERWLQQFPEFGSRFVDSFDGLWVLTRRPGKA